MDTREKRHNAGLRVSSNPNEERVLGAVTDLCASSLPLSASGGWYSADVVASEVGLKIATVHGHLHSLTTRGVLESRRIPGRKREVWRVKVGGRCAAR